MELLEYDLMFRRVVGISVDDAAWDYRCLEEPAPVAGREHCGEVPCSAGASEGESASVDLIVFSVDGTLVEAWIR